MNNTRGINNVEEVLLLSTDITVSRDVTLCILVNSNHPQISHGAIIPDHSMMLRSSWHCSPRWWLSDTVIDYEVWDGSKIGILEFLSVWNVNRLRGLRRFENWNPGVSFCMECNHRPCVKSNWFNCMFGTELLPVLQYSGDRNPCSLCPDRQSYSKLKTQWFRRAVLSPKGTVSNFFFWNFRVNYFKLIDKKFSLKIALWYKQARFYPE